MKSLSRILTLCFILVILGALGAGGYFLLRWGARLLAQVEFNGAPVAASASVVMLLVALVIARSIRDASRRSTAHQFSAEKSAAYQLFVDLWEYILREGRDSEDRSLAKLAEELQMLERMLLLYGSPGAIRAHAALRALEHKSGAHDPKLKSQFAGALMELRRDLGSETRGLATKELQELILPHSGEVSVSARANASHDLQAQVSLASNA